MKKEKIGAKTFLYPMPVVIIGATVNDKPNYITIAYCGIIQHRPPMIAFATGKVHHTNEGIKKHKTFSVNIPSEDQIKVTDYIGIHSGKEIDKTKLFETFYGKLDTAPMIKECPLNLECKLIQTVDVGGMNDIFIGQIVESYSDSRYITDGLPDIKKMKPIVFSMHDNNYWKVGDHLGKAWSIGKEFKPKE